MTRRKNKGRMKRAHTVKDPGKHSLYSRALFEHIDGISETNIGRMYCAFVGRNADVVIYAKGKALYRWDKLAWRIIDLDIISKILSDYKKWYNANVSRISNKYFCRLKIFVLTKNLIEVHK